MRRRDFMTGIAGSAAAWPLAARAQHPAMPVVGFLTARGHEESTHLAEAFRRGLGENGYAEGRNVTIEYRWADGRYDLLPAMATELARRPVAVLATAGGQPAALAAKTATATIPIVAAFNADPVAAGLVGSLSRRAATSLGQQLGTCWNPALSVLREVMRSAGTVGVLLNPPSAICGPAQGHERRRRRSVSRSMCCGRAPIEVEAAFNPLQSAAFPRSGDVRSVLQQSPRPSCYVAARPRARCTAFATVVAGGLLSYGSICGVSPARPLCRPCAQGRQARAAGATTDQVRLAINLKTAKALGISLRQSLALANEVIE
jgi:putative ABC transport system substrate-binding protein